MASKTAIVGSRVGLHARPAALVAEAAAQYDEAITLRLADSAPVDAASPLMIMTLGAEKGAEVIIESDNADAVDALAALIVQELDQK